MIQTTDVCLILEGTYPYVSGGVSSWVHSLIQGLPEITFSLLAVSPARRSTSERRYEIPPNVKVFAEVFIHELATGVPEKGHASAAAWSAFERVCRLRGNERTAAFTELLRTSAVPGGAGISADEALFSRRGYDLCVERYFAEARETSFIDYFWTWRAMHAPLFQTMLSEIPPARLYHPLSTGYAGLLGAIAKLRTKRPLLLTEHGIYVRERQIDIARADWIFEEPKRLRAAHATQSPLKALWSDFFVVLAQVVYDEADRVVTLFEQNRRFQLELGLDAARSLVIPNGVRIDKFAPLAEQRDQEPRTLRVGFVGRVVPIKDVKTLLRAFEIVVKQLPEVELWIIGPTDEDPAYFAECEELVRLLGVSNVRFTGPKNVLEIYPQIDIMVLTSISEGQPLTILEAACAGVPSVATDVGDCRALIEGRTRADASLGPCGIVTRIGDPSSTAEALVRLLRSAREREAMRQAGMVRARRYYPESLVMERYRELYDALIAGSTTQVDEASVPKLKVTG
jgi:glycosyltransferase involved in cell wall biosynthesis